ncbi:MAG TPA: radical SAM protein [Bacilli bacterium]|nr:radical SAM protein [Bacilli bacterium]
MKFEELRKKLVRDAAQKRIPIAVEIELTPYCNLKCKMCYMREDSLKKELTTREWLDIIKEARNNGMVFCLFTGGEIFTRKDFIEIYQETYDLGVMISLFTNGTLVTKEIIEVFKKRPPESISITLYGGSNETYYKITGDNKGFDKVKQGIALLKQVKTRLVVRTIAIYEIYQDLENIFNYVDKEELAINYSLYVGPRRDACNRDIERLAPSDLIKYEQFFKARTKVESYDEYKYSANGFQCVSGKAAYFITWDGYMTPCAMLGTPRLKIENDLKDVWLDFQKEMAKIAKCSLCDACQYHDECLQCPAKRYLEGSFSECSAYLEEVARLRYEDRHGKI